jgi:SAM-dependent methyltransferase
MLATIQRSSGPERAPMAYLRSGEQAWRAIDNALAAVGHAPRDVGSFLDFACGRGRVTRFITCHVPPERVWVSDIDADATAFVAERMGAHGVPSCAAPEALQFDRRFEVIFVGALFSHLPERTVARWLRRQYDLLEPDGVLLFSSHGMRAYPQFADPSGYRFVGVSETGRLDLEEYGSAFVTPARLAEIAAGVGIEGVASL